MRDPTKTLSLRRKATAEINRRFNRLKLAINDAFNDGGLVTNGAFARVGQFNGLGDAAKVVAFDAYFGQQVEKEILRIGTLDAVAVNAENHWLNKHIGEGYRRGAVKARLAGERGIPSLTKLPNFSPFANPAHVKRAELIYIKSYSDLEGVTQVMSKQVSRVLSDGILKGQNPKKVAKAMTERVDKIGKVRARLIARTEIVESHSTASIVEAQQLEKDTGVTINMKWISAGDSRVRDDHVERNGKTYTKDEAAGLIGEPNCRCAITPVFTIK